MNTSLSSFAAPTREHTEPGALLGARGGVELRAPGVLGAKAGGEALELAGVELPGRRHRIDQAALLAGGLLEAAKGDEGGGVAEQVPVVGLAGQLELDGEEVGDQAGVDVERPRLHLGAERRRAGDHECRDEHEHAPPGCLL